MNTGQLGAWLQQTWVCQLQGGIGSNNIVAIGLSGVQLDLHRLIEIHPKCSGYIVAHPDPLDCILEISNRLLCHDAGGFAKGCVDSCRFAKSVVICYVC